jgi:ectoine hydroxylase-related dioxygenase (phytanoyl-CoA dioxygenase family)
MTATTEYKFDVLNPDLAKRHRVVQSVFSGDQVSAFASSGYLLVEDLFDSGTIEGLRAATDELRQDKFGESTASTYRSQAFAGQYLREPHAYDRRFWVLLERYPIVDSVRSVLGPRITMRSMSVRITLPGTQAGTKWHADQRSLVVPRPPMYTEAHVVTCLLYLDDIDDHCGPTFVVPGSHRIDAMPPDDRLYSNLDGQVAIRPRAGSMLFIHSALWHRGGPNDNEGKMRRLVIQQFAPSWAKRSEFEALPDPPLYEPLIEQARQDRDEETLELFGFGGYM